LKAQKPVPSIRWESRLKLISPWRRLHDGLSRQRGAEGLEPIGQTAGETADSEIGGQPDGQFEADFESVANH